jgi:hypothetical protein
MRDVLDLVQLDNLFHPRIAWNQVSFFTDVEHFGLKRVEIDRGILDTWEDIAEETEISLETI